MTSHSHLVGDPLLNQTAVHIETPSSQTFLGVIHYPFPLFPTLTNLQCVLVICSKPVIHELDIYWLFVHFQSHNSYGALPLGPVTKGMKNKCNISADYERDGF